MTSTHHLVITSKHTNLTCLAHIYRIGALMPPTSETGKLSPGESEVSSYLREDEMGQLIKQVQINDMSDF